MSQEDRRKWNQRYRDADNEVFEPSRLITDMADQLPAQGTAIDVAGGTGRHACWLAGRGLKVTLADISQVALDAAARRASQAGLELNCCSLDFELDRFPTGPWDLILCVHFLQRRLFDAFRASLARDGVLVFLQPTMTNLERHAKPPARFLLQPGELPELVAPLQIEHYQEGWLAEGRHEALIVARK